MAPAEDVTAIILAGGDSRRFGRNKAPAPFRGRPMIEWVYAAVEPVVASVLVSTRAEGSGLRGEEAPGAQLTHLLQQIPTVADRFPGAGPLGGLHAGMSAAETPWVLALACDMPLLTSEALHLLLAQRTAGIEAIVARDQENRLQPLCACYRTSILRRVEALLVSGPFAMMALLDRLHPIRIVDLPDPVLKNINRLGDMEEQL